MNWFRKILARLFLSSHNYCIVHGIPKEMSLTADSVYYFCPQCEVEKQNETKTAIDSALKFLNLDQKNSYEIVQKVNSTRWLVRDAKTKEIKADVSDRGIVEQVVKNWTEDSQ